MPNTEPDQAAIKRVHVAVGVIINADSEVLLALRPRDTHQGGLWEFPGGKVEARESVGEALSRELKEELGIEVLRCSPLIEVVHDYPDKSVRLDVWWVKQFQGAPTGREGQAIEWVRAERLHQYAFPEANEPIVDAVMRSL